MNRRGVLQSLVAAGTGTLLGACGRRASGGEGQEPAQGSPAGDILPVIFLAHGSPFLLDDAAWTAELRRWAAALPRPKAVLMLSAHWVDKPVTLSSTRTVPLVYDFYNFPQKYYDVKYPAPGAPELARRVRELVSATQPVSDDGTRGLDHGAYVPLAAMYPEANVPVLQMSLPTMDPAALISLGRTLAPLRSEGVLIAGSGFLTHNMRAQGGGPGAPPPAWASEFDAWAGDALARRDVDALTTYRAKAPGVREALPTHEHFVPVLIAAGASIDRSERVLFPITGFAYGAFTRRSVQFG